MAPQRPERGACVRLRGRPRGRRRLPREARARLVGPLAVRALELQDLAGPDGLAVVERPAPSGDGAVTIDVRAAGVCFPDLLMSRGRYQLRPELPAVLGSEVGGTVRFAPAGHPLQPGDRVWATTELGGFAEVAAAPGDRVFPLPDALSFEEGASLGVNFLTAIFALQRRGSLRAGETVLVLGA